MDIHGPQRHTYLDRETTPPQKLGLAMERENFFFHTHTHLTYCAVCVLCSQLHGVFASHA